MSTRSEHLRQLASRCALKAAAAKDSAARASLEAERKQLLILAEQAARGERNRRASPMTGLRSSSMTGRDGKSSPGATLGAEAQDHISPEAARSLVKRLRLPRQKANDGKVLVSVDLR